MTKKTIDTIYHKCWEELMSHKDDNPQLYRKDQCLSFIEDTGTTVTEQSAKYLLYQWVHTSFTKYGQVILYTCRDNSEIAIEDPTDEDIDLDFLDTILPGIFFIGYD